MGFFDDIQVLANVPGLETTDPDSRWFQTKSLGGGMSQYQITEEGLLCHIQHGARTRDAAKITPINFHGDIVLSSRFVARFTNGELTWIRAIEEYEQAGLTAFTCD